MIHSGGHPQPALAGDVDQHDAGVASEKCSERSTPPVRRPAGIVRGGRHRLVGHEL